MLIFLELSITKGTYLWSWWVMMVIKMKYHLVSCIQIKFHPKFYIQMKFHPACLVLDPDEIPSIILYILDQDETFFYRWNFTQYPSSRWNFIQHLTSGWNFIQLHPDEISSKIGQVVFFDNFFYGLQKKISSGSIRLHLARMARIHFSTVMTKCLQCKHCWYLGPISC